MWKELGSLVRSDRRLTLRMISSELNLNRFTVHQISTQDLEMRKVCAKMVPKNLTTEQKANQRDGPPWEGIRILQSRYHRWWIMDFGVRPRDKTPKSGVAQWNSPRHKKARMSKSKIKSMLICFFDSQGIVHKEFVPPGQTVNQTFYREVLERLRKRVTRMRPGIARTWILHHDNAPCHTAVSINEFLAEKKHSCGSSAPLFAGFQSLWLLFIPSAQKSRERSPFWYFGNIQNSVTDEL